MCDKQIIDVQSEFIQYNPHHYSDLKKNSAALHFSVIRLAVMKIIPCFSSLNLSSGLCNTLVVSLHSNPHLFLFSDICSCCQSSRQTNVSSPVLNVHHPEEAFLSGVCLTCQCEWLEITSRKDQCEPVLILCLFCPCTDPPLLESFLGDWQARVILGVMRRADLRGRTLIHDRTCRLTL